MWTIIQGIASALGLAQSLEAWLERRQATLQGKAEQKAADDTASLKVAEDAQAIKTTLDHVGRDQLLDSLSDAAGSNK